MSTGVDANLKGRLIVTEDQLCAQVRQSWQR